MNKLREDIKNKYVAMRTIIEDTRAQYTRLVNEQEGLAKVPYQNGVDSCDKQLYLINLFLTDLARFDTIDKIY